MSKELIVKFSPVMAGCRSGGALMEYVEIPRDELDRLRTENARLRGALRQFVTNGLTRSEANSVLAGTGE